VRVSCQLLGTSIKIFLIKKLKKKKKKKEEEKTLLRSNF